MTDGNAMRPGDVIKSMSGKTIEVLNTDAEGRLVLAKYNNIRYSGVQAIRHNRPCNSNGAILVALGQKWLGFFLNDELADNLINSGKNRLWRMPIDEKYMKMIIRSC